MNKAILMGRLTKTPELRYTGGSNTAVANFTLAVNRRTPEREGQPSADFPNIVAFGKTAEFVGKYFEKGMQIVVVGRIQTRTWDDSEGKRHYVTEVVAEETYFAEAKRDQKGDAYEDYPEGYTPLPDDDRKTWR